MQRSEAWIVESTQPSSKRLLRHDLPMDELALLTGSGAPVTDAVLEGWQATVAALPSGTGSPVRSSIASGSGSSYI